KTKIGHTAVSKVSKKKIAIKKCKKIAEIIRICSQEEAIKLINSELLEDNSASSFIFINVGPPKPRKRRQAYNDSGRQEAARSALPNFNDSGRQEAARSALPNFNNSRRRKAARSASSNFNNSEEQEAVRNASPNFSDSEEQEEFRSLSPDLFVEWPFCLQSSSEYFPSEYMGTLKTDSCDQ
ncbi:28971_t:CDS:1, partial [Racocetra persica]